MAAAADGFSLRELLRDASEAGFADGQQCCKLLHTLQMGLQELGLEAWQSLLQSLRERVYSVWGGSDAAGAHLEAAEVQILLLYFQLCTAPLLKGSHNT